MPLFRDALLDAEAAGQVCDGLRDLRNSDPSLRAGEEVKHRAGLARRIQQWQQKRTSSASLWSELEGFGARAQFSELSGLLDSHVDNGTEPTPAEREVIDAEACRVLGEILGNTAARPALFADQRESLRGMLRELSDGERLDLEVLLAIAGLTLRAAADAADALGSRDLTPAEVRRVLDALEDP